MVKNTLVQLAVLLGVVAICAGESFIPGTYEREVKADPKDLLEVLKAMGFADDKAQKLAAAKMTMTITENPDKTYTVNVVCPSKNTTKIITSGKEYEDKLSDGRPYKGSKTIEGNTMHEVKKIGDIEVKIDCEFSKEGIKSTTNVSGKSATTTWKRVK